MHESWSGHVRWHHDRNCTKSVVCAESKCHLSSPKEIAFPKINDHAWLRRGHTRDPCPRNSRFVHRTKSIHPGYAGVVVVYARTVGERIYSCRCLLEIGLPTSGRSVFVPWSQSVLRDVLVTVHLSAVISSGAPVTSFLIGPSLPMSWSGTSISSLSARGLPSMIVGAGV